MSDFPVIINERATHSIFCTGAGPIVLFPKTIFIENTGISTTPDVHSGLYFVGPGDTYEVKKFSQSAVRGELDIRGDLIVDGQLFMEA